MIAIFEPLYRAGQTLSELAFHPLQLENNDHAEWREFRILLDFYTALKHEKYTYSGIFSPKFNLKTHITGQNFLDFITESPKSDVYLINPFPQLAYISHDVWMHGEVFHPGITQRAQELLDACNIHINLYSIPRHNHHTLCYSNFWVGSTHFWDIYATEILRPIENYLLSNPNSKLSKSILEGTTHTDPAPFLPFIIERLFSTFISVRSDIKVTAYPMDQEKAFSFCLNEFEKEIVSNMGEIIDKIDNDAEYPTWLKQTQLVYTKLYKHYFSEYYSHNPHPHTGRKALLFRQASHNSDTNHT